MTMTNSNILIHKDKSFAQIRISKILNFTNRQSKRTDTEKKKDFERLNEEQEGWVKRRMAGPAWTWERWDGITRNGHPGAVAGNRPMFGGIINFHERFFQR